jgi:dynein heavy chain
MLKTQPKDTSSPSSISKEDIVLKQAKDMLPSIPPLFDTKAKDEWMSRLGGRHLPVTVFLSQEIDRFNQVISLVREDLRQVISAISGDIQLTQRLIGIIQSIFDSKVPNSWVETVAGDSISWKSNNLGLWISELTSRYQQYLTWTSEGSPTSYWLPGFFNPQGFLTSVKQHLTREHAKEGWTLNDVQQQLDVTPHDLDRIREPPKNGIFIHGLYLEGASWDRKEGTLREPMPRQLTSPLPVIRLTYQQKENRGRRSQTDHEYACPAYRYKERTGKYYLFSFNLPTKDQQAQHWVLRGTCILFNPN